MTIVDAGRRPRPGPERHLAGEPRSAARPGNDLAGHPGQAREAGESAPLDDHLHEQPADGREADGATQRDGRILTGGRGSCRAGIGPGSPGGSCSRGWHGRIPPLPRPSRQPEPGRAAGDRGGAEARRAGGGGGDGLAGAGHRHGRGRPGLPGGIAGERGARAPAGGPGRARGPRDQPWAADRQDAVGPAGVGRAVPGDARRGGSSTCAYRGAAWTSWPSR